MRDYEGDDPVGFVVSLNLHRRHLDESQRAMVAGKIATLAQGSNQHAPIGAPSQDNAADMLNVGRRSVQRAREVLGHVGGGTDGYLAALDGRDQLGGAAVEHFAAEIPPIGGLSVGRPRFRLLHRQIRAIARICPPVTGPSTISPACLMTCCIRLSPMGEALRRRRAAATAQPASGARGQCR